MVGSPNAINKERIILIAIILATAIYLLLRNAGLYPVVFSDEYTYSKLARLVPLSEADLPNYLYFALYSATNSCSDGFLVCGRLLNTIFFVTTAPFIYLVGREVTGKITALVISALSMLGPVNTYTAYFMPESMYFFSFWVFTWYFLRIRLNQAIPPWVLLGVIFGLTCLIKPRAIFLLPALAVLFFIFIRQNEDGVTVKAIKPYAAFFASAIAAKFFIGFILAGKSGLTFLGPARASLAYNSISDSNHYSTIIRLAVENLKGHLLALCLLFSVPIAQILLSLKYIGQRRIGQRISIIELYTALVFAVLLIAIALYTASMSGLSPGETNARLHMRYYNYALPLLIVVGASHLSLESNTTTTIRWRAISASPIVAAVLYAVYIYKVARFAPFAPNFIDSPELRGFTNKPTVFYYLSAVSLFSLIAWMLKAQIGAKIFVYVFMPLMVVFSTIHLNPDFRRFLIPDEYDKTGMFIRESLSNEDLSRLVIVGPDLYAMTRTLFYLDNPQVSVETIPRSATYDLSKSPADKEWVLVFGDHSLPAEKVFDIPMTGITLARRTGSNFRESSWKSRLAVIAKAHGLHFAEAGWTWSSGDIVTIKFLMPPVDNICDKNSDSIWFECG
jgi:phosphoglycerol transferase